MFILAILAIACAVAAVITLFVLLLLDCFTKGDES